MIVVATDASETLALRSRVLRDGRPHEGFPEDAWPESLHLVARDGDDVVGCASFIPRGDEGWQLRGMAVAPEQQGSGVGRALLEAAFERLAGQHVWANGRDTALGFYERLGFRVVGDGYDMNGVPHHRIELDLPG